MFEVMYILCESNILMARAPDPHTKHICFTQHSVCGFADAFFFTFFPRFYLFLCIYLAIYVFIIYFYYYGARRDTDSH